MHNGNAIAAPATSLALVILMVALAFNACGDDNHSSTSYYAPSVTTYMREYDYAAGRIYDIGRLGADSLKQGDSVGGLLVFEEKATPADPSDVFPGTDLFKITHGCSLPSKILHLFTIRT